MNVKVGDFVVAKMVQYEDATSVGECIGIEGERIFVNERYSPRPRTECYLEGVKVVPIVARVSAALEQGWKHHTELMPEPPENGGFGQYREMTAFTTLLGGVAASTVASVLEYVKRENLDATKVTAEIRYTKRWVTMREGENLGGGMWAVAEGRNTYAFYIDVSLEGSVTEDQKRRLNLLHLTFHSIKDLDLLNGRTHINLR